MRTIGTCLVALTLITTFTPSAYAQQVMRRVEEPTPLDASDPRAIQSAAVVKPILAGEKTAALEALRKGADADYASADRIEKDVDAHIKRLSSGKYRIQSYEVGFGADVVVFLTNDKGESANLVVRYNGDRKITGFAEAKIQR